MLVPIPDGEEKKLKAIAMRKAGANYAEISAEIGVSTSQIGRWCESAGLVRKRADFPKGPKSPGGHGVRSGRGVPEHAPLTEQHIAKIDASLSRLLSQVDPEEVDDDRKNVIREAAKTGDLLYAASQLQDGYPEEWEMLGEIVAPDFVNRWACAKLLFYLASGIHRATALARCGIRLGEYEVWCARAANNKEPYSSFIQLCAAAQASACVAIQRQISAHLAGWQALAWSLERLNPEIYARHSADDSAVEGGAFEDVGDDNLKRAALAYIVSDNDRKAVDVEFIDLDEIEGRVDG